MYCDTIRERLDALADGELSAWAAWPVRRHLAHCPACAGELAAIQRLTARARAWQDVAVPATLRETVSMSTAPRPSRATWRPALAVMGGAAIIAAIALLTPGQPGRPTITFADVQAVLREANIVSFDSTVSGHDATGSQWKSVRHEWYRREPPAIARVSFPDECIPPGNAEPKILYDTRGILTYYAPAKYSRVYPPYSVDKRTGAALTRQRIQNFWPMLTGPFSSQTPVPKMQEDEVSTPVRTGTTTLDGRSVLTFMRRLHYQDGKDVSQCAQTIFVDPQTLHVIRIEMMTQTGINVSTEVTTNFRYDAVPPPGTFDWSPPKGAKVEVRRSRP